MNINYKETQYNFLENAAVASENPRAPRVLSAQLVLSAENLVIFTIASIMVLIFCFSLGVERGKKIVLSDGNSVESASAEVVKTAPQKTVEADDDIVASAPAKQNIFASLFSSFGRKDTARVDEDAAVAQPKTDAATSPVSVPKTGKAVALAEVQKPKAASLAATATSGGAYTVQVASYKSEKSAKREAENLKQKGYREVYVLPKGSFVIVCVGNFPTKSDAGTLTRKLKSRYQDTVVRRL